MGRRGTLLLGCLQLQRRIGSDFQPELNCPQTGCMERKKEEGIRSECRGEEGCGYESRLQIDGHFIRSRNKWLLLSRFRLSSV